MFIHFTLFHIQTNLAYHSQNLDEDAEQYESELEGNVNDDDIEAEQDQKSADNGESSESFGDEEEEEMLDEGNQSNNDEMIEPYQVRSSASLSNAQKRNTPSLQQKTEIKKENKVVKKKKQLSVRVLATTKEGQDMRSYCRTYLAKHNIGMRTTHDTKERDWVASKAIKQLGLENKPRIGLIKAVITFTSHFHFLFKYRNIRCTLRGLY